VGRVGSSAGCSDIFGLTVELDLGCLESVARFSVGVLSCLDPDPEGCFGEDSGRGWAHLERE
jgi:hypothetical protein